MQLRCIESEGLDARRHLVSEWNKERHGEVGLAEGTLAVLHLGHHLHKEGSLNILETCLANRCRG